MDDLESLELLSLVSKVTSELTNHLGISDKTLAEFVIAQHAQYKNLEEFQGKLEAMGAEFPQSLIESIDRLVKTMHPKYKGQKSSAENGKRVEEKTKVFRGLALPDKELPWQDEINQNAKHDASGLDAIDDTLALLEGLESKAKGEKPRASRKRSRSPDDDYERRGRQEKHRSRSRSADDRRRRKNGYEEEDDFGRTRKGHKSSRRRRDDDDFRRPPTQKLTTSRFCSRSTKVTSQE